RVGERLGSLAERDLRPGVLLPLRVDFVEVLLPPREETVARLAELVPERLRVLAGHRPDRLPLGLRALDAVGCLVPARRVADVSHLRAERTLLLEVLGHVGIAALAEVVPRGAEALPERLGLVGRRGRHGGPVRLELAELPDA